MGPGPREGAVEEQTVPAPWEAPSLAMRSVWTESELQRLGSRQEYWSGLPCPLPEDLPNPGIEPRSLALQVYSLPSATRQAQMNE